MDSKKVLIVEDDRMISAIFQMFVRDLGHELIGIVSEGREAIMLCERHSPDIILMDIHIKGDIDGVMTAKLIGEKFEVPIVYVTGDYDYDTVPLTLLHNTYGFLVKPLYKSTLGVAIEFAVHKFRLDRETIKKAKKA
ncbi:MAG: hypothetical protein RIS47_2212 [Bacteroidota bacterium]|jgi:response regulator of citrate/malate metabolism